MTTATPRRLKTWSIAGDTRRKPTEYEAVTGQFHYHFNRKPAPFDLDPDSAINKWYLKHREGSPLQADDWEGFRDPAALNYRRYIALQHDREIYAEGVVDHYEALDHDAGLDPTWVETLNRSYVPARYLFHVLQITSLYVGQLAPSAYITNAAFFQAADELRALQWIAYRAKSLSLAHGTHLANTEATRRIWETDDVWQPARETLERLLLAYDWGEAFVALNLVVKPALDALFKEAFVDLAIANGDGLTAALLQESRVDTTRSQAYSAALARYALAANPGNRGVIDGWQTKWRPLADRAVGGLAAAFTDPASARDRVTGSVAAFTAQWAE
ncbi:aromatic/alkene monooxygenase hydroxylase subunit beta [Mycobacterium szulgai]|uniref:propane 2-monooxygenase n=1 Tax=Mycobacterium szulgai TaxID=1787 RepID=A0A1X2ER94_MYCSZ|nr:aromatic/alkene monooxygenase hydroxylase subunit beta [Mycobacterium szulgai]MCV7079085.1 toluene hydroxylase [Mycobacterium szulgai]ORX08770.1 toluene hydroxylase [Mycobacterium szulgai]